MKFTMMKDFFIKERLFERLKLARMRLGISQTEMAKIGAVSRVTLVNYEKDLTEPNTAYLRRIQTTGIDIPFVLFGTSSHSPDGRSDGNAAVDWALLQQAFEDIEFFCVRHAPSCPSSYRWKLVAQLYDALLVAKTNGTPAKNNNIELINELWSKS
jgi:transcriptional regulator with XRE-family HTH domain